MPFIIFGRCAQISSGSSPLPWAASRPVIFFMPRRMKRYTSLMIGPAWSCETP